jgi:hypothetical protein
MLWRRSLLVLLVLVPGLLASGVCGYFLLKDWAALRDAFPRLEAARQHGDHRAIVAADSIDRVYRTNCFADGVGVLLGALLFAVGVHGLCTLPRRVDLPSQLREHE